MLFAQHKAFLQLRNLLLKGLIYKTVSTSHYDKHSQSNHSIHCTASCLGTLDRNSVWPCLMMLLEPASWWHKLIKCSWDWFRTTAGKHSVPPFSLQSSWNMTTANVSDYFWATESHVGVITVQCTTLVQTETSPQLLVQEKLCEAALLQPRR